MSLLCYIDVETTDKDTSTAAITQIAAIIVRNGTEVARINLDVNAFSYKRRVTVSKKALQVTGKTLKGIEGYPSATVSIFKLTSWLNTYRELGEYYTLVAFRTQFDLECLLGFFQDQMGDSRKLYDYFHFKTLDILQLVLFADLYNLLPKLENHKLLTLCTVYGIELDAHDALADIVATRKLHKKLIVAFGLQYKPDIKI